MTNPPQKQAFHPVYLNYSSKLNYIIHNLLLHSKTGTNDEDIKTTVVKVEERL